MRLPKSLYISCAVNNFYGTEIEIWAGFGPVGSTEKNLADYEQFLRAIFSMFSWPKHFFPKNIVRSSLKSCIIYFSNFI